MELLFWLLAGHALGDFALQNDWMANHKHRHARLPSSSSKRPELIWLHVLTSHCLLHGAIVAHLTGNIWLGLGEFVLHWIIDFGKGERWFGFHTDQALHVGCKLLWLAIVLL